MEFLLLLMYEINWNMFQGNGYFCIFPAEMLEENFDRVLSLSARNVDREILTHFVQVQSFQLTFDCEDWLKGEITQLGS